MIIGYRPPHNLMKRRAAHLEIVDVARKDKNRCARTAQKEKAQGTGELFAKRARASNISNSVPQSNGTDGLAFAAFEHCGLS